MQLGDYLYDIITSQLNNCYEQINSHSSNPEKIVHEVRKAMKRCRAYLHLSKKCLKVENYQRLKLSFRNTGKMMALHRKYTVYLNTIKDNSDLFKNVLTKNDYDILVNYFIAIKNVKYKYLTKNVENGFTALKSQLNEIPMNLLENAKLIITQEAINESFKKTKENFRKRFYKKNILHSAELCHEWRKSVKRIYYQFEAFEDYFENENLNSDNLDKVTDSLGIDHDISELWWAIITSDIPDKFETSLSLLERAIISEMLKHRLEAFDTARYELFKDSDL